jgi:ribosome maturation factor RimP
MSWQDAVERAVSALGYELVDTERTAGGLLRVYIDKSAADRASGEAAREFVNVDDCEKVTRQLQHVLEVEGCAYERLEVSSPGLDRPLKKASDYARFIGLEVDLTLRQAFQGRKKFRGVLHARGDDWRLVFHDGKVEQALDFAFAEVRDARLVPVLDFKGRRFSEKKNASQDAGAAAQPGPADEVDGGRIQ